MMLKVHHKSSDRIKRRARIKARVRKKIYGTAAVPRVCLFRSQRYLYAQCVNDIDRHTMLGMNTRQITEIKEKNTCDHAKKFGKIFGDKLKEKGVTQCVFDRSGYSYHGRVKSFVEGVRESKIKV